MVFLPLQPEGVDAVDQVYPQLAGNLLHPGHSIVEIALNLAIVS